MSKDQKKPPAWRSFEETRAFVQALGLKNQREWKSYSHSVQKPKDIPSHPEQVYQEQFLGYGDWLGNGQTSKQNRVFRPFEEARAFVHTLKLKSVLEWKAYCRSGQRPDDISTTPHQQYQEQFLGYGDWLGTGNVANFNRMFRPFEDAEILCRPLD